MSDTEYEMQECLPCGGTGIDTCHECGSEIDCAFCEGTGTVEVEE